ncbi:adenine deaminase C-terminal domain-containing protein [Niallia sp. Krafla_26]|uniref:adenine deaminase C-terminal domain-containing protein n=1 Tax=Niallia sp. Krafla_26 TaxID=3064703 RepID=UPI003D169B0E
MLEQRYRWKNKQLREHVDVIEGKRSPSILLKNARYLNQTFRKWMTANIWIYDDRIVYVGEKLPQRLDGCEIVDCTDYLLVPGYMEPHAHPFRLYNPLTIAAYASQFGTTTLINDNLQLFLQIEKKKAFSFLREMRRIPTTMYWWARFDAETEMQDEEVTFSHSHVKSWLEHDAVLQGGELTGWPRMLDGDDMMLHWVQEAKRMRKKIEGHFPGASEKTLAKMTLFGADSDHEAITGKEVYNRLMQGYMVSLRYSSIRPDLPRLLDEIHELGVNTYDRFMFTTDGASADFYEKGFIDNMIKIAIDKGVPIIDAYNMATINVARYYNIDYLHGNIATGRVANINFLTDELDPKPVSVLAKGIWVKREGKQNLDDYTSLPWSEFDLNPVEMNWDIEFTLDDLQFSMPFGIEIENTVITKPYSISSDVSFDELKSRDESFFVFIDRYGKWRINTILKGFAENLSGLASTLSRTGDIILIGKNKHDMLLAFKEVKEIGGGIVIAEKGKVVKKLQLPLKGLMSDKPIEELIEVHKGFRAYMKEKGYHFDDPFQTLLFLSTTHLPYIRVTQQGLYDVKKKMVLFPTIMR